MKIVLIY